MESKVWACVIVKQSPAQDGYTIQLIDNICHPGTEGKSEYCSNDDDTQTALEFEGIENYNDELGVLLVSELAEAAALGYTHFIRRNALEMAIILARIVYLGSVEEYGCMKVESRQPILTYQLLVHTGSIVALTFVAFFLHPKDAVHIPCGSLEWFLFGAREHLAKRRGEDIDYTQAPDYNDYAPIGPKQLPHPS